MPLIVGDWAATQSVTVVLRDKVLLKDPSDSTLNSHIPIIDSWVSVTHHKRRAAKRPLGQVLPVVLRGVEGGDALTLNLLCVSADYERAVALFDADRTLLIQDEKRQWYAEVSGDVTVNEHLFDGGEDDVWQVSIPFIEVEMP